MMSSLRIAKVFGIDIEIHLTFFLLLAFFFIAMGFNGLALIIGVFFFVTIHELCHSLAASYFGIKVKRITLLPIGGIASMSEVPTKPYQELIISLAGPLSNMIIVIVFYYPLYLLLGREQLMYPLLVMAGRAPYAGQFNVIAHIYWINLVLAVFNIIPAFPMDGGRVLRSLLAYKLGYREATKVAVRLGHIFALLFGYIGIVHGQIFLILVAVFIYMAASSEGMQVDVQETIKKYSVRDILAKDFAFVRAETPLSAMLELMLHTHQEDYPVMDGENMIGFITKREILKGIHERGKAALAGEVMRLDVPAVEISSDLAKVQAIMQKHGSPALPVKSNKRIVGVVTIDDITKIYILEHEKGRGA